VNFYKHFIGDFQRDTGHLSLIERGAYRSLLDHFYATERPLPTDMVQLCRIVGAVSKADRDAVKRILGEFWTHEPDGWTNARALRELAHAGERRETNRRVAVDREARRKAAQEAHDGSTNRATNRATSRSTKPQPIQSQTPDTRHQTESQALVEGSCVSSSFLPAAPARGLKHDRGQWLEAQAAYPPNPGRADWITAERNFYRLIDEGATAGDIVAGVRRYSAHVAATGRLVLNPSRFFGDHDQPWAQPWPIPKTRAERNQDADVAAAAAWLGGSNAA
jgi:uncharacterized protein YdaU (DUF1376 family)